MRREVTPAEVHARAGGQDRKVFDPAHLANLAASIEAVGILTPPTVRVDPAGGYELIAGECRFRAMRDSLEWTAIPVEVVDAGDELASRQMLIENVVRADLDPMAEAGAYRDRIDRFDSTPARIAADCGIPVARVRNRLRLLDLSDHVAHYVATRQLPLGHAAVMVGLDVNRQALALAAYNDGPLGIDVFSRVCGRLADEQAAEDASGLFDGADFLKVAEWSAEAAAEVAAEAAPVIVREAAYGLTEVAELLGFSVAALRARLRAEAFPAPDLYVEKRPAWWASTVEEWCADTGTAQRVGLGV